MSNESTLSMPSARPTYAAAITPLAGPLSISVAGRRDADFSAAMPPSERITKIGACTPASRTPRATRSRYACTIGASAALRTVVEKRSYSRYCGSISDESDTSTSGIAVRSASSTKRSCSPSMSACSRPTATAVMPRSRTVSTARCTLSRSSGTSTDAVVRAPLAHDEPIFAPRERLRPRDVQVVQRAAVLPPDLEHVAKAFGRDERDARQLEMDLSEQRVRRDRARVRDERDVFRRDLGEQRAQRVEQAVLRRARRRRHLVPQHPPVIGERDEVGERAADVDADAPAHRAYR